MPSIAAKIIHKVVPHVHRRDALGKLADGEMDQSSATPGTAVRHVAAVTYNRVDGFGVWRLTPKEPQPDAPHIVFMHGGGFVNGFDARHWQFLAALIQRTGVSVTALDYPFAPTHTAPLTVPWVLARYAEVMRGEGREADVVLMGDSAGAALALTTAMLARDEGLPPASRLVLLSPWLDLGLAHDWYTDPPDESTRTVKHSAQRAGRAYAGDWDVDDWRVSPLFGDLTGLPPISVFAGSHDLLLIETTQLVDRTEEQGVGITVHEEPHMVHTWMFYGFIPEARRTLGHIADDVRRAIGHDHHAPQQASHAPRVRPEPVSRVPAAN